MLRQQQPQPTIHHRPQPHSPSLFFLSFLSLSFSVSLFSSLSAFLSFSLPLFLAVSSVFFSFSLPPLKEYHYNQWAENNYKSIQLIVFTIWKYFDWRKKSMNSCSLTCLREGIMYCKIHQSINIAWYWNRCLWRRRETLLLFGRFLC